MKRDCYYNLLIITPPPRSLRTILCSKDIALEVSEIVPGFAPLHPVAHGAVGCFFIVNYLSKTINT